jgi:pyridoxamine 5'-phosphate oxidase
MDADDSPIDRFLEAFERAKLSEAHDATVTALATAGAGGAPAVRMVLLKGADERGFVFFTNHESRKGRELAENPRAALCIHWPTLAEQVRVEGDVERVSAAESDAYFATRARGSQIGAWASRQSEEISSRDELEAAVRSTEERFPEQVPRPPFWGGYRVVPVRIEFWKGQANRLHDRLSYERPGPASPWRVRRLSP